MQLSPGPASPQPAAAAQQSPPGAGISTSTSRHLPDTPSLHPCSRSRSPSRPPSARQAEGARAEARSEHAPISWHAWRQPSPEAGPRRQHAAEAGLRRQASRHSRSRSRSPPRVRAPGSRSPRRLIAPPAYNDTASRYSRTSSQDCCSAARATQVMQTSVHTADRLHGAHWLTGCCDLQDSSQAGREAQPPPKAHRALRARAPLAASPV